MGQIIYLNIWNNRIIGNHTDENYALNLVRGDVALANPPQFKIELVSSYLVHVEYDPSLIAISKVAINGIPTEVTTYKVYVN